jgi:hypothetical protein
MKHCDKRILVGGKECPECTTFKPRAEFPVSKQSKSGMYSYCKDCNNKKHRKYRTTPEQKEKAAKRAREWRLNNPERVLELNRRKHLMRKYGITLERYDEMLEEQSNGCKICGGTCKTGYALAVDHCHKSKKISGLLCQLCNTSLGSARDDVSILKNMIKYIEGEL